MDERPRLDALPLALRWQRKPVDWQSDGDAALTITAGPRTDLFIDPAGGKPILNAPCLLGQAEGDFMLRALVRVGFSAIYDAGVLLVHAHERAWAKLCFERSPRGRPTVVSVVTRGVSDDANAFEVDGDRVWLRVSRLGRAFAFHASVDGASWSMVRYFALGEDGGRPGAPIGATPSIGFEAQSPAGDGCTATFEHIRFEPERLADLRGGG